MQDEISNKMVAIAIRLSERGALLTERSFRKAINDFVSAMGSWDEHEAKGNVVNQGKQTIGQLMEQNTGLTSIEITDQNIKSFERIARKYSIDYALMKDKTAELPTYYVFFKARDADVMKAAFTEYSAKVLKSFDKPSAGNVIEKSLERITEEPTKAADIMPDRERSRR